MHRDWLLAGSYGPFRETNTTSKVSVFFGGSNNKGGANYDYEDHQNQS